MDLIQDETKFQWHVLMCIYLPGLKNHPVHSKQNQYFKGPLTWGYFIIL